jgi:hypothetical protein
MIVMYVNGMVRGLSSDLKAYKHYLPKRKEVKAPVNILNDE